MSVQPSLLDQPAPHILRRAFLPVAEHRAILDWSLAHRACFAPSLVDSAQLRANIRSSLTARLPEQAWVEAFRRRVLDAVPALASDLGMAPFAPETVQLSLIAYNDGDFYRPHVDTETSPARKSDRVLSAVYYFHTEPKAYSGGELRLHAFNPASNRSADIAPEQNALLAFASFARHEVRPVACPSGRFEDSRFAINCWVRRALPAQ
ncbi:hypothetical protein GCM10009087_53260 [Sphingomonas oligophenolica]|uniref:2OG-Fe(II) oxygenase n=1 Tax=Sphingomonas oligophenolica TaxID=301154 RepID=A0ABU9Y7J1_9SPHN